MVEIVCPSCGCQEFKDQNGKVVSNVKSLDIHGTYTCNQCNMEIPTEHVGQLIGACAQEMAAFSQLYAQAKNAKNSGDYETAGMLYQQIMSVDPNSWEAAFYTVYCNGYNCNVAGIENACTALKLCLEDVFDKIAPLTGIQKQTAVKFVVSDAALFAINLFDAAVKFHAALDASAMTQHKVTLKSQLISALNILIASADLVTAKFGDDPDVAPLVCIPAKAALQIQSRQIYVSLVLEPSTSKTLLELIGKYEPEFVEEYKKKQNRAMMSGNIFLLVLGAIFLVLSFVLEGVFAKWFCMPMAIFCLGSAVLRIIVQIANKKLNG